jgi:O-antigen/teichoic acid export membrane protein
LRDSWPLIFGSIAASIYMRIDQVMIKEMLDAEAVGQYAAAVRLSEAWYFIPVVISASLFPAIINAKKVSEKLYYERLQKLYDLMVWTALAIAIPMTFMSDWIVELLYGEKYYQAGSVLMIHIWAGVFVFLGVASGKWLLNENLQKIAFYRTFYGMLINISLNYLLIPKFGIIGAAISTTISYMFAGYLLDISNKKTKQMFFMKTKTILVGRYL